MYNDPWAKIENMPHRQEKDVLCRIRHVCVGLVGGGSTNTYFLEVLTKENGWQILNQLKDEKYAETKLKAYAKFLFGWTE